MHVLHTHVALASSLFSLSFLLRTGAGVVQRWLLEREWDEARLVLSVVIFADAGAVCAGARGAGAEELYSLQTTREIALRLADVLAAFLVSLVCIAIA